MPVKAGHNEQRPAGFTVIEMVVVITVILIVLAFAVPGLSAMAKEARLRDAEQRIGTALTHAKYSAIKDKCPVAVRVMPAEWYRDQDDKAGTKGRQQLVIYRWVTSTEAWRSGKFVIEYHERFEPRPDSPTFELPQDVWVAPLETVLFDEKSDGTKRLLEGYIGADVAQWYQLQEGDADGDLDDDFFFPDDFLIIFDADGNLVLGPLDEDDPDDNWTTYAVHGLNLVKSGGPAMTDDGEPMQRYASSGVVVYSREALTALGVEDDVDPEDRQEYLRDFGEPHFVHPRSGALVRAKR